LVDLSVFSLVVLLAALWAELMVVSKAVLMVGYWVDEMVELLVDETAF
jgi:hypothetical protein